MDWTLGFNGRLKIMQTAEILSLSLVAGYKCRHAGIRLSTVPKSSRCSWSHSEFSVVQYLTRWFIFQWLLWYSVYLVQYMLCSLPVASLSLIMCETVQLLLIPNLTPSQIRKLYDLCEILMVHSKDFIIRLPLLHLCHKFSSKTQNSSSVTLHILGNKLCIYINGEVSDDEN